MSRGSHAAGDGSFGRSAGIQLGRAVLLLAVAVLIGLILLRRGPSGGGAVAAVTSSTKAPGTTVTTAQKNTFATSSTTRGVQLRARQDIKVLVANGTGTQGLAGTVSTSLHGKGYDTLASTNSSVQVARTVVYFQPSYDADAVALAGVLGVPASAAQPMPAQTPVAAINGAHILVVVGSDLPAAGSAGGNSRTTSTTSHTSTS